MVKCLLTILVLTIPGWSAAQPQKGDYQFEHMSLEQGVTNTLVWCIYQDRKGFLWYGTMYGLVKYDGYEYIVYRHDPSDTSSIAGDDVLAICEDRNDGLWVGTYGGGASRLDRKTGTFTRYLHTVDVNSLSDNTVWDILVDREGTVWFATDRGGLDAWNPVTRTFIHFRSRPADPKGLHSNSIRSLCEGVDGTLWVGTGGAGLQGRKKSTGEFLSFTHDSTDPTTIGSNSVSAILQDTPGVLWIGTRGGGLNKFMTETGTFVRYHSVPGNGASLPSDNVNRVIRDRSGALWVATGVGLARFDVEEQTFITFRSDPVHTNSLSSNSVTALLQDRSGILWIGTYNGGLDRLLIGKRKFMRIGNDPATPGILTSNEVTALLEDRRMRLWVGTRQGLNRFDPSLQVSRHWTGSSTGPGSLSGEKVNALCEDSTGTVWVGTARGLNRFDEQSGTFQHYLNSPHDSSSLSGNGVNVLLAGRRGELWVGTNTGLNRLDAKKGSFVRYIHSDNDPASLAHDVVLSLIQDHAGTIFAGTYGGVSRFDRTTGAFTNYRHNPYDPATLSNNYVLSMYQDNAGRLWIGTGGGLNLFDPENTRFTCYREKDGLPNEVICGILEDRHGMLWLSTNRGLSCFDVGRMVFRNYNRLDGLQSNMFLPGSAWKRRNGGMLFGGINGFNLFAPESLKTNAFVPPVFVTTVMLFDDSRRIRQEFAYRDSLQFSYKENFFALSFSALDFTRPEKNSYAYKLEGFDRDWVSSGRNHFARYTNLDPGEYVFRVKGTNNDGVWNEAGSSLIIMISPPYWKTLWFKVLALCFCAGCVVLVHRLRVRARVRQSLNMESMRRREAEQVRKKAANDFHDELGHRLTKIGLFTEIVKRKLTGAAPDVVQYLDKIIEDSQSLTDDTHDFIWTLDPDRDSLFDLAIHLREFGEELFDRTGITYAATGISEDLLNIKLPMETRRHLTMIFKEGMNNIVKHSGCRHVTFDVSWENGCLRLSLSDDGRGYTEVNGSGYGLKSMKQRAEKIHSSIRFDSQPGKGSRIEVTARTI